MVDEINIGYFENFGGDDTILFSCTKTGIETLKNTFKNLASENLSEIIIENISGVNSKFRLHIKAIASDKGTGMIKFKDGFIWDLPKNQWKRFVKLMDGILKNGEGHQYLDSNVAKNNILQVIVSYGEYDNNWWEQISP